MKISVRNFDNKKVKELDLPDEVFNYPYNEHLIHTTVQAYLAGERSGTHKAKARGEVTKSGRKPWRQKGTGRARAGRASSPLWTGGGTAHGPRPRSYRKKLSPAEKRNALKSALSRKLADAEVVVLEHFNLETHKTGDLARTLAALGVEGKALLVDEYYNENLGLAARNNQLVKPVDALGVTVYDVVDRSHLVISAEALGRLIEVLSK